MDQPLMVHHPTSTTTTGPTNHHNLPGSAESSPRSTHHHADWEEPLPPVPGAKLRLMCSYGGHIIPRPHDKSLCYVGGETRMVVVERTSSLADLTARLSRSLLEGRRFTLKYQLPHEDLDSLISVATDEDLENMVEEYDRLMAANSPLKPPGRLRLFLFLAKPETAKTMGVLLDDAKSETWFVDALNGADLLPRGLSDSAAMDDLLSLGSGVSVNDTSSAQANVAPTPPHPPVVCSEAAEDPKVAPQQDVHSIQSTMPDAPMIETTTSSFESSTSSPSMAHLPPIRVRVDEGGGATRLPEEVKGGGALEEQFMSQLRVTPPLPTAILTPSPVAVTNIAGVPATTTITGESLPNRVISDDERSDHAMPVMLRKPPLPLPLQPMHQRSGGFNMLPDSKHAGGFDLPSPDSVKSDSSIASTASLPKAAGPQDPAAQLPTVNPSTNPRTDHPAPAAQNQTNLLQPTQDQNAYVYPPQHQQQDHQHQQQFVQAANMHYIPAHTPIPSYYHPVYATQQPIHPQVEHQQYPMYLLPVTQAQPYNLAVQPTEPTVVPTSSAAQAPAPVYPSRATAPGSNPGGLIQVAPNSAQFQQQYVGYSTAARPVAASAANYGNYNYGHDQQQHHMYYTGQLAARTGAGTVPLVASQYQSITPAQAAMIAEASKQLPPTDSSKQSPRLSS